MMRSRVSPEQTLVCNIWITLFAAQVVFLSLWIARIIHWHWVWVFLPLWTVLFIRLVASLWLFVEDRHG